MPNITVSIKDIVAKGGDCPDVELFIDQFGESKQLNWNLEEQMEWLQDPIWKKHMLWGHQNGLINMLDMNGITYKDKDFSEADLSGMNLRNSDFSGCDFSKAKLVGTDFTGAKLVGCNFTEANISRARFRDADLSDSDLTNTDVTGIIFGSNTILPAILL